MRLTTLGDDATVLGTSQPNGAGPKTEASKKTASRGKPPPKNGKAANHPPSQKASIHCGPDKVLPEPFVKAIGELEIALGMPVWMLVQGDEQDDTNPFGALDYPVFESFRRCKASLPRGEIALVIDSPGGDAHTAYQLAMLLRRNCGAFTAVIPRWAKSAATLLSLAASEIHLGEEAQLGPLDAQILDADKEERYTSALDEVGAIQELEEGAIEAAFASLRFIQLRTRKKLNILMPFVFDFVAKLHQPLFDKIDSIRFSRTSRVLSIAEKYAIMLLQPQFSEQEAGWIARDLVKRFPSHRFCIDKEHSKQLGARPKGPPVGLHIAESPASLSGIMDELCSLTGGPFKAIGRLEEMKS